jgi:glucose/arabinose dehydrogenase
MPLLLILLLAAALLAGCGGDEPTRPSTAPPGTATDGEGTGGPAEAQVETVATGLEAPWEIAFLPDRRALLTERPGRVRLLSADGELAEEPLAEIAVDPAGEGGLLGLALDPQFEDTNFVYLYRTADGANQVLRTRLNGDRLVDEQVIVDNIPAGTIHNGGRLAFSPEGDQLFITAGDAGEPALAQNEGSLAGKLLRLSADDARREGGTPEIHSLGHRNQQGLAFEPETGRLFASEHGQRRNDEVNRIEEGANYGWPETEGREHGPFTAPLAVWPDETIAPSGMTFVTSEGAWAGDLLVAGLRGEQLRRLRFDGDAVTVDQAELEGEFGRLRTVVEGPDGALYVLTNNRDGRGDPEGDDDRILRITPPGG